MILTLLYFLFKTIFILFTSLVILITIFTIWVKLKLEPVNGVCKSNTRLDGKVALVTGGNSGIGLETARDLANRGARVVIACRDAQKSAQAIEDIAKTTGNKNVEFKQLDLAKFSSVRKFVDEFNKSYDRLDLLINNAGCASLKPKLSEDGIDIVMQVNYFGPFLLTNLLLDKVVASRPSRIVIVSSWVHNFARLDVEDLQGSKKNNILIKYSNSKLCDVLWMKALAKRLPKGVVVNALHPGVVKTNLYKRLHPVIKNIGLGIIGIVFKSPKEGAQTTLHLCVDEDMENVTGKYFMECKEASYSKLADDDMLIEKVWNNSVALTSK